MKINLKGRRKADVKSSVGDTKEKSSILAQTHSRIFRNAKIGTVAMLISVLAFSPFSGYVLATLLALTSTQNQEPVVIGNFTIALQVNDVNDLYAWQTVISFNSNELKVLKVTPGGFVGTDFPFFINTTNISKGLLLLGGSLFGDVPGKNGSDILAIICFGYFANSYNPPKIVEEAFGFKTMLLDSNLNEIAIEDSTLTLNSLS